MRERGGAVTRKKSEFSLAKQKTRHGRKLVDLNTKYVVNIGRRGFKAEEKDSLMNGGNCGGKGYHHGLGFNEG